ncbi:MAG: fibronectin type III domain-containing protein [Eggerthella sp.]|nr:fibronectin type III domain-containing protein [Eggerthella sp.]
MPLENAKWVNVGQTLDLGLAVWIVSQTDLSATVRIAYAARNKDGKAHSYNNTGGYLKRVLSNGSLEDLHNLFVISGTSYDVPASGYKIIHSQDFTITKTKSTQNVGAFAHLQYEMGGANVQNYVTVPAIPVYNAYAPTSVTAVRNSDNKITVSWSVSGDITHPVDNIRIERKRNDEPWVLLQTLSSSSTALSNTTVSYNGSYRYRVCATNSAGLGAYKESNTVYNTPATPVITRCARVSDTEIAVALQNQAYSATKLDVEVLLAEAHGDMVAGQWYPLLTLQGKVEQFTVGLWAGLFQFRARNILVADGGTLASGWSTPSAWVSPAHAPDVPILLEPASSAVVDIDAPILFKWRHNPIDGSPQTTAELRYSDDGETWTTVTVGAAESYTLEDNEFDLNSTVQWQMRTKGAYKDYSEWSGIGSFVVRSKPVVVITEPNGTDPLENVPLHVSFDYEDVSGSLANAQVKIIIGTDANAPIGITFDAGTSTDFDVPVETFMPDNHTAYTLVVQVRSTSTFTVAESRTFQVEFVEPMLGDLVIEKDPETGYVAMTVQTIYDEDREDVVEFSIWRVSESGRKLLAEHLSALSSIVDMYAPLNVDYYYEVVSFAASGVFATNRINEHFVSAKAFFYWQGKHVGLMYSPEESESLGRPNKKRQLYPGRAYPVSYDSDNMSHESDISGKLFDRSDALMFRELITDGGRCIYKSLDGDVYNADAEVSFKHNHTTRVIWGTVSINLVRIDGGLL